MRRLLAFMTILSALLLCSCSLLKYDNSSGNSDNSDSFDGFDNFDSSEISGDIESSTEYDSAPESSESLGGFIVPTEFTEDDLFVQNYLKLNAVILNRLDEVFRCAAGYVDEIDFVQLETPYEERTKNAYVLASHCWRDIAAFKADLNKYLTSDAAERFLSINGEYMANAAVAELVDWEDDIMSVEITEGGAFDENGYLKYEPRLVEIDGFLYCHEGGAGSSPSLGGIWSTAHVISRADDEIVFKYTSNVYNELVEMTGILKYEDDWKFAWYFDWLIDE